MIAEGSATAHWLSAISSAVSEPVSGRIWNLQRIAKKIPQDPKGRQNNTAV